MRKVYLLTTFVILTPLVLLLQIVAVTYFSYQKISNTQPLFGQTVKQTVAYAALPPLQNVTDAEITQQDARVEIVRQFFAKYNSPLEPYAEDVVSSADQYSLDFRIIPSIAMQESNLCLKAPVDSKNCWGFGIYGGKIKRFDTYLQGIETVTKTLATNYRKSGLDTPEEIMTRYTPSSNGSWANGVNFFMNQLQ